jgi:hypothetical protein
MTEMKIPKDSPRSVDRKFAGTSHPNQQNPVSSSETSKDSLQAFSANEMDMSAKTVNDVPQLKTPEVPDTSLLYYFKTINAATLAFRHQLQASDLVDQDSRRLSSQTAALQAEELIKLYETRKQALAQLEAEARKAIDDLQKKFEEMEKGTKEHQDLIDQINSGNALEKQKYQELTAAYDDYLKKLNAMGVVDRGDGSFDVPEGMQEQFNAFTQEYQKKVDLFNVYWKQRLDQINQYNSATQAYNKSIAENNQFLKNLINQYNLSDFLKENGLTIPTQVEASFRDLSGYHNQIVAPSPIHSTPVMISIPPLPDYARSNGRSGPPALPKLESYRAIDGQKLYDGIYRNLYDKQIVPIDQKIQANYTYWAFLNAQKLFYPTPDTVPDPLLNTKRLALNILPAAFIEAAKPAKFSTSVVGSIALRDMGVNNSQVEEILGRSLFQAALSEHHIQLFKEKDGKFQEEKINEIIDRLLLLSVGFLSNQSLQALFPSLSFLSQSLETLPKDSPAFALLFAVSLANRIQEDATQGISAEALQNFLGGIPGLETLTDEDKTKLGAILNLGQLLVAGKILETTLGLPGLMSHLLPTLSPSIRPDILLSKAAQEGRQNLIDLQTQLQNYFVEKGYPQAEAQFLGQVGTELTEQGLLTPTATSVNAPDSFDQLLLMNSIQAALVLSGKPLTEAQSIAHEAIERTLVGEGPYHSTKHFRKALESQLRDLGVGEKSGDIAIQAILIPPKEKPLNFLSTLSTSSESIVSPTSQTSPTAPIPTSSEMRSAPNFLSIPSTSSESISSLTSQTSATVPTPTSSEMKSAPPVLPSVAPTSTGIAPETKSKSTLSPIELKAVLEKRTVQLLAPQLGLHAAKEVAEEIVRTLFGSPSLDVRNVADVKSTYSWVNVMKDQLQLLNLEKHHDWIAAIDNIFKETIITMENFYAFSLKVMNPAYLYVYSSHAGIIYGDRGINKPRDLLI